MIIHCQEHYDEVVKYAERIGDTTLSECIERLKKCKQDPDRPCTLHLSRDFAPYSFLFSQVYSDGSLRMNGGLIYHGVPDQSCSVLLNTHHGWSTHT